MHGLAGTTHVFDVGRPGRAAFELRLLDVTAQLHRSIGQLQVAERAADVLGGDSEHDLGGAVGQRHHAVRGHHDLRRRAGGERLVP